FRRPRSWPVLRPSLLRLAHPHRLELGEMRAAPVVEVTGEDLGGGAVMAQHVIQVAVIELLINITLQPVKLAIVADEAMLIELAGSELDLDHVIVAVQARAGVISRQM